MVRGRVRSSRDVFALLGIVGDLFASNPRLHPEGRAFARAALRS